MVYIVRCRIDFADGDYSIEDYDGVLYSSYDEATAAKILAESCYGIESAWVVAVEEGD